MYIKKIGFFDSGVGGLSVLQHFLAYDIQCVYVADTAFVPYGNKTIDQLQDRCKQSIAVLDKLGIDTIMIACNTAVIALPFLEKTYPHIRFIQAVDHTVFLACQAQHKKVGVLATRSVIDTGLYTNKLKKLGIDVVPIACPMLASTIEVGNHKDVREQVRYYCALMKEARVDAVILACTHYHAALDIFKQYLSGISIITSDKHKDVLGVDFKKGSAAITYYVSGDQQAFRQVASNIIGSLQGTIYSF